MNKVVSFVSLMLMGTVLRTGAMNDSFNLAGSRGSQDERRALTAAEMVVISMPDEVLEKGIQTENASLMREFEFIGERERHELRDEHHSISTQVGLPIQIIRGLQEESIDDVMRKALLDDQKEKALAMKKRMKYVRPCYCVFIAGWIYVTYLMPR